MPFVQFTARGKSYAARASISKSGMISFSEGARKRFQMEGKTHCLLFYDNETRRVGIRVTDDSNADGAVKLRFRNTGADIGARTFAQFFDIDVKETMLYTPEWDEAEQMIMLDLNKGRARKRKE